MNGDTMERVFLETMAVPVIELDAARLRSILFDRGIRDAAGLAEVGNDALGAALASLRLAYANSKALELFGTTSMSMLSEGLARIWPDDGKVAFRAQVAAMLEHHPSFDVETKFRRMDGSALPVLYASWASSGDLDSDRIFVSLTDISLRVRAEETLGRVRADLAHAGRLSILGELTASIAHEVSQPLAAVAVGAKAGMRWLELDDPNLGEVKAAFQKITAAGRLATDVVSRMRAMAKNQQLDIAAVSVEELIHETMLFLRHELASHQTSIRLDLTESSDVVLADRTQVQQVLVNLIMNAAQAMSRGRCWRRVVWIRSRVNEAGGMLVIDLEDTGPGIADEDRHKLFESFFSTKPDGMGIGLPICRSIVDAHGGSISVTSRGLLGTTFTFSLPLAPQG
jgi:PAS domain S-box-containing protein